MRVAQSSTRHIQLMMTFLLGSTVCQWRRTSSACAARCRVKWRHLKICLALKNKVKVIEFLVFDILNLFKISQWCDLVTGSSSLSALRHPTPSLTLVENTIGIFDDAFAREEHLCELGSLSVFVCSFMRGGALHTAQCYGELQYAQFRCCKVSGALHKGNLVCVVHQTASTKWSLMCCTLTGSSSGIFKTVLVKLVHRLSIFFCSTLLLYYFGQVHSTQSALMIRILHRSSRWFIWLYLTWLQLSPILALLWALFWSTLTPEGNIWPLCS